MDNLKLFSDRKIKLENSNLLVQKIKNERNSVIQFIKNTKLKIKIEQLDKNANKKLENKLENFANVYWVDKNNLAISSNQLDKIFKITWETPNNSNLLNTMFIKTTNDEIKKIIKRVKFLIYIGEYLKLKTNNIAKPLEIYLVLSELKKYFPEKDEKIKIAHVNGGYTNLVTNIIFVWRKEEWEKILIHEIIHYFDMDMRDHRVELKIPVKGPKSYFEAVTDFWGLFYHLIYLSVLITKKIKTLLELELTFIENQAMALNDFLNLGSWQHKPDETINQTTPALSYYILKYLLFKYFLENNLSEMEDYNGVLNKITAIGFEQIPYVKLESSRRSLLQLD